MCSFLKVSMLKKGCLKRTGKPETEAPDVQASLSTQAGDLLFTVSMEGRIIALTLCEKDLEQNNTTRGQLSW